MPQRITAPLSASCQSGELSELRAMFGQTSVNWQNSPLSWY